MNESIQAFQKIWINLEKELEKHRNDINLSFGLEYSTIVEWVADLTPRKNHQKAREYGNVWQGQGHTPEIAIQQAIDKMNQELNHAI